MSKKDVDEYYQKVCKDYSDMIDALHDLEAEANNGIVSPDKLEAMKQMIEPLKTNYMTLSWIMFLMNKPVRKSKQPAYERRNAKLVKSLDKARSQEGVLAEDREVINKMKENVKSVH